MTEMLHHVVAVRCMFVIAAVCLVTVRSADFCDVETPVMWYGACGPERTAVVVIDTSNFTTPQTIDVYFNDTKNYTMLSQSINSGYNVLSLPKSLFAGDDVAGIVVEPQGPSPPCNLNIFLKPTLSGLVAKGPPVMVTDTVNTVVASVKVGMGVSFSFTISLLINNTLQHDHIYIVKACNMHTLNATMQFVPTVVGEYSIHIFAFMDRQFAQTTAKVISDYPITQGTVGFGPFSRSHKGYYYPGDTVNIIIKSTSLIKEEDYNRPLSPNCTIDWGDNTVLNEEDVDLQPNSSTGVMYTRLHNYTGIGIFSIAVRCYNRVNAVNGSLKVKVSSPAEHATAYLQETLIPLSSKTQDAKGILIVTHPYLTEDWQELNITVDFDMLNSKRHFTFTYPLQPVEQLYTKKGSYMLGVTFEAYGVRKQINLALQVGAIDFYIKNKPRMVKVNQEQLFELVRFTKNTVWDVEVNFGPENTTQTFLNGTDVLSVPYTYVDIGIKTAVASVAVNGIVEVAVFEFETVTGCISNTDLFDVTYRSEQTPLLVLMSELSAISGRVERFATCNSTEYFLFDWQLSVNTGLAPVYVWDSVNITQPETVNVILKHFIYKSGLYRIILSVTAAEEKVTVSDTMFLQVIQPFITAYIFGGTFTQHSIGKSLVLDAEIVSYNLMTATQDNSNLSFSWACFMLKSEFDILEVTMPYSENVTFRNQTLCPSLVLPDKSHLDVPTTNFTDEDLVLFEVTAHKNGINATAVRVVQMLQAELPEVSIKCVWNCGARLVTSERTVFTTRIECTKCSSLDVHNAKYQWSLFKFRQDTRQNEQVSWDQRIMSDPESKSFDSEGGWWEPGTTYTIYVVVKVGSFSSVTASQVLFTNLEAYNGICDVEPHEGKAGETGFIFSFTGWKDEYDRPVRDPVMDVGAVLRYRVQQKAAVETPAVFFGAEFSSHKTILSPCGTEDHYCNVDITVIDPFRGKSTCTVTLKVTPFAKVLENESKEEQFQTVLQTIESINEHMRQTKQMGDSIRIAQNAAVYSTVLSSLGQGVIETREFPFFDAANITSKDALPYLLNPLTEVKPTKVILSMAIQQLVTDVGHALQMAVDRGQNDLNHQINFAKALVTMTTNKNLLSGQSLQDTSALAAKLSVMLVGHTGSLRTMGDLKEGLDAIAQLLSNIVEACAVNVERFDPDSSNLKDSDLSRNEVAYITRLVAKRKSYSMTSIKERAPEVVRSAMDTWKNLISVCRQLEHANGSYEMNTRTFFVTVQKTTRENLKQGSSVGDGHSLNSFSVTDVEENDNFTDLHMQVLRSKNIYIHGTHSKFITSDVFVASVVRDDGTEVKMTAPRVTHDVGLVDCSVGEHVRLIAPKFTNGDAAHLFYHNFYLMDRNARVCIVVKPAVSALFYRLYVKVGSQPTDISYDYRKTLSLETLQNCKETCIPPEKLTRVGKVYVGLRPLFNSNVKRRKIRKREAVIDPLVADYLFGITSVACYNWEAEMVDWEASRCKMIRDNRTVTCTCSNGPELVNALYFNLAPNTIHFPSVFSKFDMKVHGAVFGLLLAIYFIFALVGIWAHYRDRKGIFQWGVFPLADNYADEDYFYLITVHTGLRKSAGTKSNVSFCLSGELDETGVRQLTDRIREGIPTASVLHFVMACPASLGDLQCLRIWHDNSGKGSYASWYLDRIDVTDIQTGQLYFFVCEEWLVPENNTIDKIIETSNVEDLQTLKSMMFFNTKKRITDEHIWLSVVIQPEWNSFSRFERTGCCLAFLLLAMITSAMFYKGAPDSDRQRPPSDLQIGPIRLSIQQLYYSMVSAVITAIPIAALVTMFRRARLHSNEDERSCCCRSRKKDVEKTADPKAVKKSTHSCCAKLPWMAKLERQLEGLEKILLVRPDAEEIKKTWPWFWRYVAWLLVVTITAVCSFFVILYTIEWGKDITEEWLSSFFLAFLESMFVVDPFKVVFISFLLSVFVRKPKMKGVDELDLKLILQINREYGIKNKTDPPRECVSYSSTLSEEQLKVVTRKRKIHVMIRSTLWELVVHFVFIIIISSICYSNRTSSDYRLYNKVYTDLVSHKDTGFSSVTSTAKYFAWLENVLVPWLFPEKDQMDQSIISEDRQYTAVWSLYRLGAPRLRQVRMRKGDCVYQVTDTQPCTNKYSIFQEETAEFCIGWSEKPCPQTDQLRVTAGAWYFRSALSISGLPIAGEYTTYGGGGYIVNLDINLIVARAIIEEMKKYLWIYRETSAVFLEFTLYCPNVNRFVYVTLLAEFIETGGVVPFYSIYPFRVHRPAGYMGTFVIICEVLYLCFTALGFFYVIFVFWKQKLAALNNRWFLLDILAVAVAIVTESMFYMRLSSAKIALSKMKEDRTQFMNFHHVAMWDTGFITSLGFLIAVAYVRLLKLAGCSERTMRVFHVLKLAVSILPSFFAYIFLVILSFAFLGFAMFSHTSPFFKNFGTSITTLFTGILGHAGFKETNLPESDQWETVLFFCLFVLICVMFLTNLFLAILLDILTLSAQKDCDAIKSDEAQIFSLLWDSILKKLQIKRDPVAWMQIEDPPDKDNTDSQVKIEVNDQFERIARVASRMLDDQDGAAIMQWTRSHENQKLNINSVKDDLNYAKPLSKRTAWNL